MVIPDYAAINMDAVKLGVCVRPMNHVEQQEGRRHIVHASEHEVKVSMGEGKGAKSYECDFEVRVILSCFTIPDTHRHLRV